jgi:hypothetical protein
MANKKKKSNETDKKGFWASSAVILGVISAVLGIVLSVYNILAARHNRQQFGVQDEKATLENERIKQEVSAYEPRFEVAYISISSGLYNELKQKKSEESKNQAFFLSYPLIPNEVASETLDTIATLPTDEANGDELEERVTCLVLQNKGKRDAVDVTLHIDRLAISRPITIQESSGKQGEDYDAKFRGAATSVDTRSFEIPESIGTGAGVLIPLFASRNPLKYVTQNRTWFLVSGVAYLPKTIMFIDPLDNQPKSLQVRKMKTPTWIDIGYEVRG